MRSTTDPVEEITVTLAGLDSTIAVRPHSTAGGYPNGAAATSSATGATTPAAGATPATPTFVLGHDPVSLALIDRAIETRGARDLGNLALPFLEYLLPRLRSSNLEWPARARLGRAFRAGIEARLRLEGQYLPNSAEAIPFRTYCYICLRTPGYPEGFWTADYNIYIERVLDGNREFHSDSISHGFPTRAETEAYLVGAGRSWPLQLQ
eukprot:Skav205522  [mRNA]  locus=scaffold4253:28063:28686:+ [translate_table: standard]